jgi:pilus assembly protein Flp/PilA
MARLVYRFCKDRSGATAIEYAILAGGIALAIIVTVQSLGTAVNAQFGSVLTALK